MIQKWILLCQLKIVNKQLLTEINKQWSKEKWNTNVSCITLCFINQSPQMSNVQLSSTNDILIQVGCEYYLQQWSSCKRYRKKFPLVSEIFLMKWKNNNCQFHNSMVLCPLCVFKKLHILDFTKKSPSSTMISRTCVFCTTYNKEASIEKGRYYVDYNVPNFQKWAQCTLKNNSITFKKCIFFSKWTSIQVLHYSINLTAFQIVIKDTWKLRDEDKIEMHSSQSMKSV